jgi:hypothetical protein
MRAVAWDVIIFRPIGVSSPNLLNNPGHPFSNSFMIYLQSCSQEKALDFLSHAESGKGPFDFFEQT